MIRIFIFRQINKRTSSCQGFANTYWPVQLRLSAAAASLSGRPPAQLYSIVHLIYLPLNVMTSLPITRPKGWFWMVTFMHVADFLLQPQWNFYNWILEPIALFSAFCSTEIFVWGSVLIPTCCDITTRSGNSVCINLSSIGKSFLIK